jgi:hypothetical protein
MSVSSYKCKVQSGVEKYDTGDIVFAEPKTEDCQKPPETELGGGIVEPPARILHSTG